MAGLQAAVATKLGYGAALSSSMVTRSSSNSVGSNATILQQQRLCGGCGVRCVGMSSDRKRAVRVNLSSAAGESGDTGAASPTTTKSNSILCKSCGGNGAVVCSQCDGGGVNTEDRFGGRFKAGTTCWLCRGKRQMLCGSCNGAGFMGGFMNTQDE